MPPSVANFLSTPATLSKNPNLSVKSTSPTSSDPSAFPTALKRAGRFDAQEPREVKPASEDSSSKVSRKPAKPQASKKKGKGSSDDVEETTSPKSKRTKTATIDAEKPVDDSTAVEETAAEPSKGDEPTDVKADPSDAQAALAQAAAQQAPTARVEPAEAETQGAQKELDADGNSVRVVDAAADAAVAKTEGDSDSGEGSNEEAHEHSDDDAIAKALADHVGKSVNPKEAGPKVPVQTEAESGPALGATSTGEPHSHAHPTHTAEKLDAAVTAFSAMSSIADASPTGGDAGDHATAGDDSDAATFDAMLASAQSTRGDATPLKVDSTPAPAPAPRAPEERFALENHEKIISSVKSDLLPGGGTMKIKLDPPELGPMAVAVHMRDGVMTATFETSSDEAAKLLSHSLGQLKSSLEAQGISVERLHVQQTPKSSESRSGGEDSQQNRDGQSPQQEASARQDQQRKEMLRRMWRKLSGFADPLDVTG